MTIPQPLREDWALTRDALKDLTDERTLALMARPGQPVDGTSIVETRPDLPGVAIIHVKGTLTRYKSWWGGGTTYGQVLKSLRYCLDDSSILAIAFNFDSPGGEVNSCAECADAIFAARGKKPMAAYASYLCASGGLWLASSVGDIYCAATAILGSVGVLAYMYDDTKMLADVGIKQFEILASQSPKKGQLPADADYRARVQQRLDDTCDVFIAKLARNYGVSADYVQKNFGQGDVFVGQRAVDAKLARGISSFETVLASLASSVAPQKSQLFTTSGAQMDMKAMARLLRLDDNASERQLEDRAQQLAQLERSVLVATQSTDHDTAIGKIGASMAAVAERDAARAELGAERKRGEGKRFKAQLKAGCKSTKLVLGQLPNLVKLCMSEGDAAKAVAAMAQVQAPSADSKEDQKPYKKALIAAMCAAVDITPEYNRRLEGYLSLQQAQLPAAKKEPGDNKENRDKVSAVSEAIAKAGGLSIERAREIAAQAIGSTAGPSVSEADAAAAGISLERAQQLAKFKSAADLPPPAAEKKGN